MGGPFPGVEVCIIGPKEVDDKEMEAESDELTVTEPVIIARSGSNGTVLAPGLSNWVWCLFSIYKQFSLAILSVYFFYGLEHSS